MSQPDLQVQLGTTKTLQERSESIFQLYYDTFSKPPYRWPDGEDKAFRKRLARLAVDSTFGIAIAQIDRELIGFAYGYALRPDTSWWNGFITPVPEEMTTEWEGRTFALIDFAVAEAQRGKGIGGKLHNVLLGSRHESRATLAVEPAADQARTTYEHWGWRVVGRLRGPTTDFAPEYDIMVRDLSGTAQLKP